MDGLPENAALTISVLTINTLISSLEHSNYSLTPTQLFLLTLVSDYIASIHPSSFTYPILWGLQVIPAAIVQEEDAALGQVASVSQRVIQRNKQLFTLTS